MGLVGVGRWGRRAGEGMEKARGLGGVGVGCLEREG